MNTKIIAGSLLAAVLAGLYLFNSGMLSISSDETSRTLISYFWFRDGVIESSSWLPLHFLIIGTGFYITEDLVILPRLISLFFGLLTISAAALLTFELFKSREVLLYALIILVLIPQRLILSAVPLPEIIFIFFVITGALFFFKWIDTKKNKYIIFSVVLIAISCMLRYEGWIIAVSIGAYALIAEKKIYLKLIPLLILAVFPLFWFAYNYVKYDDLLYFIREPENYYMVAQEKNLFNMIIFNPIMQFIEQNLITMNIIGIACLYLLRKNKKILIWTTVFFLPLFIFSISAVTAKALPAHNFWRTTAVWVILLIPFTAYVLQKIRLAGIPGSIIIIVLFFVQLINADMYYLRNIKNEYCLTDNRIKTAEEIINYVNKYGEDEERIIIENLDTFEHLDIALASQEPYRFILSRRHDIVPYETEEYSDAKIGFYLVKSNELKELLRKGKHYPVNLEIGGWSLYSTNSYSVKNSREKEEQKFN